MKSEFDLDYDQVVTKEPVIYGDFFIPNAEPRIYAEIDDFTQVLNLALTFQQKEDIRSSILYFR